MTNAVFRERFITTLLDIANNNFSAANVTELLETLEETYKLPSVANCKRFYGNWTTDAFSEEIAYIDTFFSERLDYLGVYIQNLFEGCGDLKEISVSTDPEKGKVRINTSVLNITEEEWTGRYFEGYTLGIECIPYADAQFSHWVLEDCESEDALTESRITITLSGENPRIEAVYR